jgi:hypothetical protein
VGSPLAARTGRSDTAQITNTLVKVTPAMMAQLQVSKGVMMRSLRRTNLEGNIFLH